MFLRPSDSRRRRQFNSSVTAAKQWVDVGNSGCRSGIAIPSEHADLTEEPHLVVEQVFLHDLAVLPSRNGAELQLEGFSGRVVHLAMQVFPRTDHLSLPAGDGA